MNQCIAQKTVVPDELLGELVDSTTLLRQPTDLRASLAADGYVLLRGVVGPAEVQAAREEVFGRLADVGEIRHPPGEGIATGQSRRKELVADLGEFWRDVSQGPALRHASHGPSMREVMSTLIGVPARAHDYIFLRPGRPGQSTRLHYDRPFFSRGSDRIYTAWLALGEVRGDEGPLMIVEGSNQFQDQIDAMQQVDYQSAQSPTVQVMSDTVEFVKSRASRLLTTEFGPGDLVVFDMLTLHGTLDNQSAAGRVRLSCDVRWQPATDPLDARYQGENPPGTTGAGYGELNGAKPLTEDWHTR